MPNLRFDLVQEMDDEANYGHYDLITCMEVLEHVVDTRPVIDRLSRLLTPDGRLIISVPVETGAPLVLKQAARRIAGWRGLGDYRFVARYNWAELIREPGARSEAAHPKIDLPGSRRNVLPRSQRVQLESIASGLRAGLPHRAHPVFSVALAPSDGESGLADPDEAGPHTRERSQNPRNRECSRLRECPYASPDFPGPR